METEVSGSGVMKYANGDVYKGYIKNGKREGEGVLITKKGDEIEGTWKEDKKHGLVTCVLANGDYYRGVFTHDEQGNDGISIDGGKESILINVQKPDKTVVSC
jgi:hypothetical protein